MLKRLWSDHRNACLLTLALLVIGIVVSPWVLLAAVLPIRWVLQKSQTGEQEPPQERILDNQINTIEPLTGKALLDRAKSLSNRPEDEIAKGCGYVEPSGRVLRKSFYRALVEAKGYKLRSNDPTEEVESIEPFTGTTLLEKIKELGDVSKSDLVKECGYVSTKKDGGERLNYTEFYQALLEAKGVDVLFKGSQQDHLDFIATVDSNGDLEIDKKYTELLDLKPGDQFDIKIGRKGFRLVVPCDDYEEENS